MRRREVVALISGAAVWPLPAHSQQLARIHRIASTLASAPSGWEIWPRHQRSPVLGRDADLPDARWRGFLVRLPGVRPGDSEHDAGARDPERSLRNPARQGHARRYDASNIRDPRRAVLGD